LEFYDKTGHSGSAGADRHLAALFGGFSDERYKRNPQLLKDPEKVLVIKGVVLFGGDEIKIA
jgi:hypothetical protein